MNVTKISNVFSAKQFSSSYNAIWYLQRRYKAKTNVAAVKRKNDTTQKALDHFDDFYGSVFGAKWDPMRKAMLRRKKYVALVNNFGDTDETIEMLTNRGAHCLKKLTEVDRSFREEYYSGPPQPKEDKRKKLDDAIHSYSTKTQEQEISGLYPGDSSPDVLEAPDITLRKDREDTVEKPQSLAYNASMDRAMATAEIDRSRVVDPESGLTSETLLQYVPVTKLKGMEDWVPESQHYAYYTKGKDFPLTIEPETTLEFPEHLKVYTYELENVSLFPEPKRSSTGVFNYYPLDGASVLTVLALGLRGGERVLDMCAAPGGKTLVMLQSLQTNSIMCLDNSQSRINRIRRVLRDYLPEFETSELWRERVTYQLFESQNFEDEPYDKVLVDVPCTTDRHALMSYENNMFRSDRVRERLRLPELQAQLLLNALRLVRVGGTVVYSTCSLSPIQNDGVVHAALKQAFELHGIQAVIKDLSAPLSSFRLMARFGVGVAAPRYGALVTPHVAANFGPAYFSKMERVK